MRKTCEKNSKLSCLKNDEKSFSCDAAIKLNIKIIIRLDKDNAG